MDEKLTLLEAFEDLTSNYPKNYSESYHVVLDALKENEYLKTELLGQSQELNIKNKVLEIIKKYFILTSEYGMISFRLKKEIPEDKYEFLKEILK